MLISQIICIGGLVTFVISMQMKTKEKILLLQIISFIMYSIQYFILPHLCGKEQSFGKKSVENLISEKMSGNGRKFSFFRL